MFFYIRLRSLPSVSFPVHFSRSRGQSLLQSELPTTALKDFRVQEVNMKVNTMYKIVKEACVP